jgi:hypothetical protein
VQLLLLYYYFYFYYSSSYYSQFFLLGKRFSIFEIEVVSCEVTSPIR